MIIRISDPSLTTTLSVGTTVADNYGFYDEYSTTVSCLTSSMTTQPLDINYIYLNSANNYINSLSNEQLLELEQQLSKKENDVIKIGEKEFMFDQITEEKNVKQQEEPKVKAYKKI